MEKEKGTETENILNMASRAIMLNARNITRLVDVVKGVGKHIEALEIETKAQAIQIRALQEWRRNQEDDISKLTAMDGEILRHVYATEDAVVKHLNPDYVAPPVPNSTTGIPGKTIYCHLD